MSASDFFRSGPCDIECVDPAADEPDVAAPALQARPVAESAQSLAAVLRKRRRLRCQGPRLAKCINQAATMAGRFSRRREHPRRMSRTRPQATSTSMISRRLR
jgi:hypothetical protein